MAPSFRVILRSGPNPGKVFPLEKVELFVGRDLSNDVVINDPEISRRHSRLFFSNNAYLLEDLGSTNGTSVNGQRLVSPTALRHGDIITLGERITLLYESVAQTGDAAVSAPDRAAQGMPSSPQQSYPSSYNAPAYEPPAFPQRPQVAPPSQAPVPPAYQPAPPYQQMPAAQPQYQQMPPPPPPAYDPVQPAYSGQVPLNSEPEPVEVRYRTPTWVFILIGILLLLILLLVIDDFKLWTLFGIG